MGMNAAAVPDLDRLPPLPPFLRDQMPRPKPLKPSAEECFRRSLELGPDQLETHEELVHFYQEQNKPRKAEQAARELLERFPTHVSTLQALANLRIQEQDYAEGISLLERASAGQPARSAAAEAAKYRPRVPGPGPCRGGTVRAGPGRIPHVSVPGRGGQKCRLLQDGRL